MITKMKNEYMMKQLYGEGDKKKLHDEKRGYIVKKLPYKKMK